MKNAFKSLEKVIWNLVELETEEVCGDYCGGVACTRDKGHSGFHIATGGSEMNRVYAIWGFACGFDRNKNIERALELLPHFVYSGKSHGCTATSDEAFMCMRKVGHKGLHVACASGTLCEAWTN
jgi:hypothetical protein